MNKVDHYFRKIIVIVYASVINFFIASYLSQKVEKHLIKRYEPQKGKIQNLYNICLNVALVSVYAFILRQISEYLPLPLASESFEPSKVKEVKASVLSAFTIFIFLGDDFKSFKEFLYEVFKY
jgi:hypothetical protein